MAVREGGVYRREKDGAEKQLSGPTREQRFGAHATHPSKKIKATKATAAKVTDAGKSTPVKDADNADSSTDA